MKRLRCLTVGVAILVLSAASVPLAQQNKLPNGRPFQMLHQEIAELDAELSQQIADLEAELAALEGRVDALEQHDAVQDQLIGALQAAIALLEQRMAAAENDIDALAAWNAAQDAVLAQLSNRINQLQSQVNAQGSNIGTLFNLHVQQQILIGQLQGAINFLFFRDASQQGQLSNLQNQLNVVNSQYQLTRARLAQGCPPNFSIRQIGFAGQLVCEPDSGQFAVMATGFTNFPPSGQLGLPPGGIVTVIAVCPPGQFAATGGGYTLPAVGAAVLQSQRNGQTSWRVTVRNTNLPPFGARIGFQVSVACARLLP